MGSLLMQAGSFGGLAALTFSEEPPEQGSTFFASLTTAGFTGRPDTNSPLEAVGDSILWSNGDFLAGLFGSDGVFDPHPGGNSFANGCALALVGFGGGAIPPGAVAPAVASATVYARSLLQQPAPGIP